MHFQFRTDDAMLHPIPHPDDFVIHKSREPTTTPWRCGGYFSAERNIVYVKNRKINYVPYPSIT